MSRQQTQRKTINRIELNRIKFTNPLDTATEYIKAPYESAVVKALCDVADASCASYYAHRAIKEAKAVDIGDAVVASHYAQLAVKKARADCDAAKEAVTAYLAVLKKE